MSLRIDRHWGKDPGWFMKLSRKTQTQVWAEFMLAHESQEQSNEKGKKAKRRELDRRLNAYQARDY